MDIDGFISQALQEDLGDGDHSSLASVPENATGKARLLVKDDGILAGVELAKRIFHTVDPNLSLDIRMHDGAAVKYGDEAMYVSGSARSILAAERLVLNCMQRMSGIATRTHHIAKVLDGLNTRVLDTRKTTPLIRFMEKWAVRIGGGTNHRFGLYDMIMLKDNHIDYAGGIAQAITATKQYLQDTGRDLKIEIETRNLDEVQQVLEAGNVHRIMLDNFSLEDTRKAVEMIGDAYETESSGGITLDTIRGYAECGVDYISVGALTHSVKSLDLSLKAM